MKDRYLDRNVLQHVTHIGQGNFGNVYRASIGKVAVAVKELKSAEARSAILCEATFMHAVASPYIVQLLGVCVLPEDQPSLIVLEFMEKGTLKNYLSSEEGKKLKYVQLLQILFDVR